LGADATELLVETFPQRWVVPGSPTPFQRAPGLARARLKEMQARLDKLALETWHIQRELQSLTAENYVPLGSYDNWAVGYYNDLRRRAPTIPDGTDNQPLVTIICPVYRPRLPDFVTAIRSVLCQTYPHWELIIVDDNSQQEELASIISELTNMDKRIRVVRHAQNLGISEATNTAIRAAQGDFIAFFDHDDMLVDVALQYSLAYLLQHQGAFCYSDEDKIDDFGRLSEPNFKSDWNLRLVLAQNYVCHFLVVRRDLVEKVGYFKTEYDGAQDHDYVMRLSEHVPESSIMHIPEVLYHWRKTPDSTATTVANKQYAIDAGVKAVQDYMDRSGALAKVRSRGAMTNYIIDWVLDQHPSVSIIIPFKDNVSVTSKCVDGVLANTDYENFEVVLVDNYSMQAATDDFKVSIASNSRVRIVNANVSFNYSLINNLAVETCRSEVIAFLNNDVFISDPSWLSQMLGELFWKSDIGAVGCKLLYESGTVQHAGVILGVGHGGVADHPFRGLESNDPGYMGRALCSQELSAVTAACLVCRKSLFDEAGGFDARELPVAYNDIDLCLKIRKKGRKIIWRAETIATHAESASRSSDLDQARLPRLIGENQVMKQRWGQILANDPYYHRLFSRERGIFQYLGSRGDVIPLL
jgi:glycosyltransferase involved in cell wall biosynthesis